MVYAPPMHTVCNSFVSFVNDLLEKNKSFPDPSLSHFSLALQLLQHAGWERNCVRTVSRACGSNLFANESGTNPEQMDLPASSREQIRNG